VFFQTPNLSVPANSVLGFPAKVSLRIRFGYESTPAVQVRDVEGFESTADFRARYKIDSPIDGTDASARQTCLHTRDSRQPCLAIVDRDIQAALRKRAKKSVSWSSNRRRRAGVLVHYSTRSRPVSSRQYVYAPLCGYVDQPGTHPGATPESTIRGRQVYVTFCQTAPPFATGNILPAYRLRGLRTEG